VHNINLLQISDNRNLQTYKPPLESHAQGTSLFTSTASNQRGFPEDSLWKV